MSLGSWLRSLLGGGEAARWRVGDQLPIGDATWTVAALLVERGGGREWVSVRLAQGRESVWATIDGGDVVRYDPLPGVTVGDGDRVLWDGRTYACSERGRYTVVSVAGDVDAAPGDRAEYLTLTSAADAERWISVERWENGSTEVSLARPWRR